MTENEEKAVKFIENIKSHATVTLDHIAKEEPNVSPLIYKGREEKADTILKMIEELRQYRAIGTPEECRAAVEKQNRLQKTEHWKILTGTIVTVMLTIRLCIAAMRRNQKMRRVLPILFNTEMVRAKEGVCVEIS